MDDTNKQFLLPAACTIATTSMFTKFCRCTATAAAATVATPVVQKKKIASSKFNSLLNFSLDNSSRLKRNYNLLQNVLYFKVGHRANICWWRWRNRTDGE